MHRNDIHIDLSECVLLRLRYRVIRNARARPTETLQSSDLHSHNSWEVNGWTRAWMLG